MSDKSRKPVVSIHMIEIADLRCYVVTLLIAGSVVERGEEEGQGRASVNRWPKREPLFLARARGQRRERQRPKPERAKRQRAMQMHITWNDGDCDARMAGSSAVPSDGMSLAARGQRKRQHSES